ncbi:Autoinducer 2 sensor kinase/phosphatase LuxQ [Thermoflexales bacterium]|nr:Autoinducer 2 sensor kinase/phosphatase LuxQ [Thermoflexales bacterium]
MPNSSEQKPNWFRRLLTPPAYSDEDLARAARLLHAILLIMWVVVVVSAVPSIVLAGDKLVSILIWVALVIPVVLATVLLHAKHVKAASTVFIIGAWLLLTGSTLPFGGSVSPTVNSYILLVIIAGLLLGGRGAIVTALLNITTLTVLLLLTEAGLISQPVTPTKPADIWANVSIGVGLGAALLYLTTKNINQALTSARRTSAALQQTNRELNTIRASLEERVTERTAQLNVSAEVAQAVSSILDPTELISQVTRLIVERFNLYYAAAFLVDEDSEFAEMVEATGRAGQTLKERGHRLELSGPSMVGSAIATRRPRIAQDVDKETMRFANPLLTETKSEAALPLIVGDRVIGALDVQSTRAAAFDEDTVAVLQGLANQIAIALNNAQQYQLAQLDARQASMLFEASQAAGFLGQGLDFAINRLFGVVAQRAEFDNWMMGTYDRESRSYTVHVVFDANEPASTVEAGQIVNIDQGSATPATLTLQANQMLVINDPTDDPQLDPMRADHRATLGKLISLPIKLGDRLLGVLILGRTLNKPNIGPRDIQLAQALASQLAVAIDNHRLLEQSQKSVDELNRLMRLYMHEGWSNFSQSRAAADLREEYTRPDASPLKPEVLLQIEEALNRAATTVEIKPRQVDGQSVVSVPIELRGEIFGALTIQDADRQWTEDELTTLQSVAAQVAQSLEAARLLEESETSLQDTMVLYRTSRSVAAAQTPAEILHAITSAIVAPQVDRAVLALLDADSPADDQVVEVIAAWERNNPAPEQTGVSWRASQLPLIKHQSAEPMIFGDLAHDQNIDPQSRDVFMNVIGAQGIAVIPMIASGRLLGWILLEAMHEPYNFTEQEIRRYRTLAGQAAVALENRRLFQDVQARVNELTILTRIGRRLASTLDLDEILSSVIEEAFNATKAANGGILLYNERENALELRTLRGLTPELEARLIGLVIHNGEGLVGRVLDTGEALLINDVTQEPDYQEIDSRTRSELVLPIRQGGLLLGVLNLESPIVNAFSESELRLLEAMADQAAVAITNARAYEAERQAVERMREVDRLKTQFLANMSHELRTPLNSIIGFSRVMLRGIDGPLTEMQSTDLTSIYNSGQHLLGLINNMLDLSKIEAGKMELAIESVNLVEIGKTVMSTALALIKDKTVKLEQEVPQDLPTVMADQTRVRQIILNLVSNAAKFTEKGSIRLSMVAMPKEVMISVTDTGIGIPQDKIEHIFEEFTQVDASTTRKYGGTGLGLAITRKFVEMHKGRIWVESQVGIGSTFNFTLPREQAEPEPDVSLPTDLEARGAGKKLILCIDDDPGVITLYKRYLEKQNYRVIGVTDPVKAVEEAKRLLPYAITLDVMMPRKDGWDVLAELKKTPEISNTPILICSIIQDKTRGFSLGAADYLVKPITEDELRRALERINREHTINKILVVDDEPSALNLLKRILESKPQYKVLDASGGAQALAIVEHDKPDLILLDLMMPEVDGFAVLDNIKSHPATRDIPVIVVTAKDITAEDRERLNGHMAALYNKGMFTAEQLLADISTALQTMDSEIALQGKKIEVFHKTLT